MQQRQMLLGSPSGCLPGTLQRGTITWLVMKIKCFHSPVSRSNYNVSVVLVGSKFNGQLFPSGRLALVTPAFPPTAHQSRGNGDFCKWQKNANTLILFAYS